MPHASARKQRRRLQVGAAQVPQKSQSHTWESPTPTRTAAISFALPAEPGVSRTAADHSANDQLSTRSPPKRCAAQPPGTCKVHKGGMREFGKAVWANAPLGGTEQATGAQLRHMQWGARGAKGRQTLGNGASTTHHLRNGIAPVECRQHRAFDAFLHSHLHSGRQGHMRWSQAVRASQLACCLAQREPRVVAAAALLWGHLGSHRCERDGEAHALHIDSHGGQEAGQHDVEARF